MAKYQRQDKPAIKFSDEELAFCKAVDAYKQQTGVRYPSLTELLSILKSLGYKRCKCGGKCRGKNEAEKTFGDGFPASTRKDILLMNRQNE